MNGCTIYKDVVNSSLIAIGLVTEYCGTDGTQCNNVLILQCTMTWAESSSSSWWVGTWVHCELLVRLAGGLRTPLTTNGRVSSVSFPAPSSPPSSSSHQPHTTISHSYPRRYKHTGIFAIRKTSHCSAQFCTSRLFQPGDGPLRPLPSTPIPIAII